MKKTKIKFMWFPKIAYRPAKGEWFRVEKYGFRCIFIIGRFCIAEKTWYV